MTSLSFRNVSLPDGADEFLPTTISIAVPATLHVERERLHLLTHIPWNSSYLKHVPGAYHDFFKYALPYLTPRTTSVHTAVSVSFVPELQAAIDSTADLRLTTLAVILHDCGWSQVSPAQIADSLDYAGVRFTRQAAKAKRLHAEHGGRLAAEILRGYEFKKPLTEAEIKLISDVALYHERPSGYQSGRTPSELIIACEADRMWPYTHESFWLDITRKGVEPSDYIQNVAASIGPEQFLTATGQRLAWRLMNDRISEVAAYESFLAKSRDSQTAHRTRLA